MKRSAAESVDAVRVTEYKYDTDDEEDDEDKSEDDMPLDRRVAKRHRGRRKKREHDDLLRELGRPLEPLETLAPYQLHGLVRSKRQDPFQSVRRLPPDVRVSVRTGRFEGGVGPTLLSSGHARVADLAPGIRERLIECIERDQKLEQEKACVRYHDGKGRVDGGEETVRWMLGMLPAVLRDLLRAFLLHTPWSAGVLDSRLAEGNYHGGVHVRLDWKDAESALLAQTAPGADRKKTLTLLDTAFPNREGYQHVTYDVETQSPCRRCYQAVAEGWEVNGLEWNRPYSRGEAGHWSAISWKCAGCFMDYRIRGWGSCPRRDDGGRADHWVVSHGSSSLRYDCLLCKNSH